MWTEERILLWKRTGEKPSPVMVWTPEHTGLSLDPVAQDRLYALWHLVAFRLDLLTYGADRQTAYYTIGPVTVAYVLLGVAAGALAGTLLRRAWTALVAAPALTWLLAALLVRSRAVLLLDFTLFSKVHGYHPGGLLGLQFYDALPQDSYLVNSLDPGDYWGYQVASSVLVLVLAALLALAALRVVRQRTAQR